MIRVAMSLEELNLIRQWFNAVSDLAPKYLGDADRVLGKQITDLVKAHENKKPAG